MQNIADKVSEAELEILKVLWANDRPMTDRQIRDALNEGSDWKATTIQTLIKRLLDKSALFREKKDVFYYSSAVSREEFEKSRTEDFIGKVFGGNAKGLLSTLLNNDILSKADMNDLKNYWQEMRTQDE
ncbi:MAG: BlaI/MecI/CopY family transcriptional regulator [Eubacterium sp.]|jgi:predicted transcriptional regulator|nr:BlaI/MecI/CopY family transcriptional regulator [Eubacterium sp.]